MSRNACASRLFLRISEVGWVALVALLMAMPARPQSNAGRILGNVSDQSGAAVASATVDVTNAQTGVVRNLTTDQSGQYVAPDLLPGTYTVHVAVMGFKTVDRRDILLETGRDLRVDIQLSPGEVTQTVEVTGAVPLVDATGVTLGGTLSNDTINELPLNGRNYQNLLSLRPGVEIYPGGGAWTQSTNGIRPEDQNYMVDGLDNNEAFSGQSIINSPRIAGDAATILPIDAIQEFNVEENPKAEFGWKPGSVVNVSIKSGTNAIHGTAYAFGRTDSWDAKNYFIQPGQPNQPLSLEQWGGTFGGHIVKDKLFYFGGFENQRYTVGNAVTLNIPTSAAGVGAKVSIPDAEAALANQGIALSPLSLKLLPLYGPNSSSSSSVEAGFPNTNNTSNAVGKVDYNINARHSLGGSYFFGNGTGLAEDNFVTQSAFLAQQHVRAQAVAARWAWTPNSRWVNELRFGFNRYYAPVQSNDHAVPATSYGINTGVTVPLLGGLPKITVSGLSQLGANNQWPNLRGPSMNYDLVDQLSYSLGKHAFKFGGEIRDGRVTQVGYGTGKGVFTFSGKQAFKGSTALEDFLAGNPTKAQIVVGYPGRTLSQWGYAAFVQDDWRIKPRVTLNLGLRWEYDAPPTEANNLLGNWEPTVGLEQVGMQIGSVYRPDRKDFGPRAGVAWDVTGKGTTIIRVGGGLMYDVLPMNAFINAGPGNANTKGVTVIPTGALINGTPGSGTIATTTLTLKPAQLNWTVAGPVLPAAAGPVSCSNASPCSIMAMDRNFKAPYVATWTLSLQHAFSNTLSLETAYVGDHGDRLMGIIDVNQADPATGIRPYATAFPYLQYINFLTNLDRSNYHGLQATLTARNYHNLSVVAGYTYAHALDDVSHNFGAVVPQNSLDPNGQYGPSDFDIRHRFTVSVTYNLPGKKSPAQLLEGWQINSIVTLQTAQPWDAVDTGDDISTTGEFEDRWDFFGNPGDFQSNNSSIPYCTGPGSGGCTESTPHGTVLLPASQSSAFWTACQAAAAMVANGPGGTTGTASLNSLGCYARGKSVMVAPAAGNFGTLGRNAFRDSGFRNMDLSLVKSWKFNERLSTQFRAEFFNVLNHPNFMNPTLPLGQGLFSDPSVTTQFGCGCQTPDVAAVNPVLGSGGNRAIQLGLKFIF
jgi:Carboxypeptidase regulatory-like domain/TonB dependent receptor